MHFAASSSTINNQTERVSRTDRRPRSRTLLSKYNRRRTDAPATHVYDYELEIARWQARKRTKHAACKLTCSVCLEIMDPSVWIRPTASCTHEPRICESCLGQHVEHAIRVEGLTEVTCPDIGCRHEMDYADLVAYLREDSELLNRFTELAAQRELEKNPNYVYCTNPICSQGWVHDPGASAPLVICRHCHTFFCFTHRVPWHDRLTCEQYTVAKHEGENHASEDYIGKNAKRCPSCRRPIEKAYGCDHFTCRPPGGCGHEFCWICLADYGPIRTEGNHLHDPSCRHYAKKRPPEPTPTPQRGEVRHPFLNLQVMGRRLLQRRSREQEGYPALYRPPARITPAPMTRRSIPLFRQS